MQQGDETAPNRFATVAGGSQGGNIAGAVQGDIQPDAPESTGDLGALARGGRTNVLGFVVRLGGRIPFLFIGGQMYGAAALGRMAYAVVIVEFAAQLATLGMRRGLGVELARHDRPGTHAVADALALVAVFSLPMTALLLFFPQMLFPNSSVEGLDRWIALVVLPIAATEILLAALAYRFNVGASVAARSVVEPWTISIAAFLLFWPLPRDGLILAYAIAMVAAFASALRSYLRAASLAPGWRPDGRELTRLMRRNLPLAGADAIDWTTRRVDIAILGLYVSPVVVGGYYVAQQLASLPQKLKTSFDPVLSPVLTTELARGDYRAVASALSRAGFWILAAQVGIALMLGIPGEAIMGLIGARGVFVAANGALAFLLITEVVASSAVVSEHGLVYIARHRNLLISLATIALQIALTFALIHVLRARGFPDFWLAAAAAAMLCLTQGLAAIVKRRLLGRLLGHGLKIWRWPLAAAAAATAIVGTAFTFMPEWVELSFGEMAMFATYASLIWIYAFQPEDRALFASKKPRP